MGGVVRVSGSGLGCGDKEQWPFCHGQWLPPLEKPALIEFTHRWLAVIAAVLLFTLAGWVWIRYRRVRPLAFGAVVIGLLYIVQIALGAVTVLFNLPNGVIMIHLANALLLLGALVWIAVSTNMAGSERPRPSEGTVRLATVAAGATYLLVLSVAQVVAGALVVDLRLPAAVRAVHLALATGLWVCVVVTAVITRGVAVLQATDGGRVERASRVGVAAS